MSRTDRLIDKAASIATTAAVAWLRKNGVVMDEGIVLHDLIVGELESSMPDAMAEAKEAFACGMTEVGVATFSASMHLAGYRAAQAYALQSASPV